VFILRVLKKVVKCIDFIIKVFKNFVTLKQHGVKIFEKCAWVEIIDPCGNVGMPGLWSLKF
jgi:hypothetical protein